MARGGIGAKRKFLTLVIIMHNKQINALINFGASWFFIAFKLVNELGLERRILGKGLMFQGINGGPFKLRKSVTAVKWHVHDYECF